MVASEAATTISPSRAWRGFDVIRLVAYGVVEIVVSFARVGAVAVRGGRAARREDVLPCGSILP